MTAHSKSMRNQNGYRLRCNGCAAEYAWVPGRVGAIRAAAREQGWTSDVIRRESGGLTASWTVWDKCETCSKEGSGAV